MGRENEVDCPFCGVIRCHVCSKPIEDFPELLLKPCREIVCNLMRIVLGNMHGDDSAVVCVSVDECDVLE